MKITYTAGPDDVQRWDFDPDNVTQSQAELVEKRYGQNWDSFLTDVRQGSARARKVLLWHLLRQVHHTLRIEDVPDFRMGDVKVEHSLDELLHIRDRVVKASLAEDEKEGILAALDLEITEAMGEPGKSDPVTEPAQ